MRATIAVRVGDLLEIPLAPDRRSATTTVEARVMDVDPACPSKCAVQISPYEPFRHVDLSQLPAFKLLYAVGEVTRLTAEMVGWEVEIQELLVPPGKDDDHTASYERGVIKQVDGELNCALVVFDDGRKDWRDLTMNAFKVLGGQNSSTTDPTGRASPAKTTTPQQQPPDHTSVPRLPFQRESSVHAMQTAVPTTEASEFDWYTEGGHVELCDQDGVFLEGALLCSYRDQVLQLYNEQRQFFEIQILQQSFKVVIHGLVALKSVPLGQAVEVYAPMHGAFLTGLVMKAAEVGKLTPVKVENVGVEWLDLTSQTFKLVFLSNASIEPKARSSELALERSIDHTTIKTEERRTESRSASPSSKRHHHQKHHHSHIRHCVPQSVSQPLPVLSQGDPIELLDAMTKQFTKHRITHVYPDVVHTYDVEVAPSSSSHGSGLAISVPRADTEPIKRITINLAQTRARLLLTADQWEIYQPILHGCRVDVYNKTDRSVLGGKIIDSSSAEEDGPRIHVKLKDKSKRWFQVKSTKIKLKLMGDSPSSSNGAPNAKQIIDQSPTMSMWQRIHPPVSQVQPHTNPDDHKTSVLARQHSEKTHVEPATSPVLARYASSPVNLTDKPSNKGPQPLIPSLDLSSLVKERAEPVFPHPPTPSESLHMAFSTESHRSTSSSSEALSDLLPAMDDLWVEEPTTGLDGLLVMRYVHPGTGHVQYETPQWLSKVDESSGEPYILNTITSVRFQSPGTTTPLSSDRAAVLTLPIGPLEAARMANQMNSSPTSAERCGEASSL